MIRTNLQLRHSQQQIIRFEAALVGHPEGPARDALLSVLSDLQEDVANYLARREKRPSRRR